MTLRGDETGNDRTYTDTLARDRELAEFAEHVTISGDATLTDLQAEGEVVLVNGEVLPFRHDLNAPLSNDALKQKLVGKAVSAIGEKGRRLSERLVDVDRMKARELGALLAGAPAIRAPASRQGKKVFRIAPIEATYYQPQTQWSKLLPCRAAAKEARPVINEAAEKRYERNRGKHRPQRLDWQD